MVERIVMKEIFTKSFRRDLVSQGVFVADLEQDIRVDEAERLTNNKKPRTPELVRRWVPTLSNEDLIAGLVNEDTNDRDVSLPKIAVAIQTILSPWIATKTDQGLPNIQTKELQRKTGLSTTNIQKTLGKYPVTIAINGSVLQTSVEPPAFPNVQKDPRMTLNDVSRFDVSPKRIVKASRYKSRPPGGGPARKIKLDEGKIDPTIRRIVGENARIIFVPKKDNTTSEQVQNIPLEQLPNIVIEDESGDYAQILGMDQLACLTQNNVRYLFEKMAQSPNLYGITTGEEEGVKIYMVNKKAKEMLQKISGFLSDLSKMPTTILLPESEDEMNCFLTMTARAITTGKPITLSTPFCPDWSRDSEGKYDFKSLGGGESFIAAKFFANAPAILSAFDNNGIPFVGRLRFADWGLETEIDTKGTYGQKLSQEDIQMCFASTLAATDQMLKVLQNDPRLGKLFSSYRIVSMKEFLANTIDEEKVKAKMKGFFTTDEKGRKLLEKLAKQSFSINKKRLGLSPEENREFILNSLVEYSTEGEAEDENTILIMCESRTTSRCYNLPRDKDKKIPVFYVKGQGAVNEGVNIL